MTSDTAATATNTFGGTLDEPTSSEFAHDGPADEELRPYRVKVGDVIYSQEEFLGRDRRFYNFTSGIGAGKTVSGILRVAANVEVWNPGETGMIVTPTSLGLKNVILPELSKWGFLNAWEYKGPQSDEPGLHSPNGTRIILESAENDRKIERLRGPSIAWFWIDEAALVPKRAWEILLGRLRTGEYRNAFITTTPKGRNWVHELFVDEETRLEGVKNVLGVPSYANPHLPLDYRRDILAEYEGNFHSQEVMGQFVSFEGLVYPWFGASNIADPPQHYDEMLFGVDFGHNNPATIIALARTGTVWTVIDEWYERRCTVNDQAAQLEAMVEEYGPGPIYCDPSEPANIETFQRNGLDARAADNDVLPGIQTVASYSDSLYVSPTCQATINEFNSYQYRDGGDSEKPLKQNDHAMDGVRYALHTHAQRGADDGWLVTRGGSA